MQIQENDLLQGNIENTDIKRLYECSVRFGGGKVEGFCFLEDEAFQSAHAVHLHFQRSIERILKTIHSPTRRITKTKTLKNITLLSSMVPNLFCLLYTLSPFAMSKVSPRVAEADTCKSIHYLIFTGVLFLSLGFSELESEVTLSGCLNHVSMFACCVCLH